MKNLSFYKDTLKCETEDQVFSFLISTLKPSGMVWSYFVDWEKVFSNVQQIELALNNLNYLIGKEDFDESFKLLLKENSGIAKIIPALVARVGNNTNKFQILIDYKNKKLVYKDFDFSKENITDSDIEQYLHFVKKTGLKDLITNKKIKNLVDYMIGVEAGLDSNGRKNRGGHIMEDIVEVFIKDICKRNDFSYSKEANAEKIKEELNRFVPSSKASYRHDFVIDNGKELFIIETNFYGGGSKLNSIAGQYRDLSDSLKDKCQFIWITDGKGWEKTQNPLRETFDHNDYLFNLAMLEKGILEFLLK